MKRCSHSSSRLLPLWAGLLLAALAGCIMALSFIPIDWRACVWIGFIPLLSALWSGPARHGRKGALAYALYGWLFGVVFYGISFWWVNEVSTLGYIPLMIFYGGLFPGIWCLVMGTWLRPVKKELPEARMTLPERRAAWKAWAHADMPSSASTALAGAALWVCLEWARGWLIPGFGWNNLGVALYGNPLAQWAEFTGVTTLTFLPVVFSIWLWCACRRSGLMVLKEGKRSVPWDFFVLVAVLLGMFVAGVQWTARYAPDSAVTTGNGSLLLPVMTVQLNLSQKEKWAVANRSNIYRDLLAITEQGMADIQTRSMEQAVKEGREVMLEMPSWVIWPESSFPISTFYRDSTGELLPNQDNVRFLSFEEDYVQAVRDRMYNFILLTGTDNIYISNKGRVERAYNSLTVFEGDYSTAKSHAKAMLVPFGEYIPMRETFPFLEKAFEASSGTAMGLNYSPGDSTAPVPVPIRPASNQMVGVIPLICFEDVVGSWVRRFVRQEPQIMVNVTNDGWFNNSCANEQHWRNAAFRCIELRRSMIRAANTGVSMALAPNGAVIEDLRDASGSPFTRGVMFASLPVGYEGVTLYAMLGDWAVGACFLLFAALLLRRLLAPKKNAGSMHNGVYLPGRGATPK